jgi:chromosome segregation ATPase
MIRKNRKLEADFSEHDTMDEEFSELKSRLTEAEENAREYRMEAENQIRMNKKLQAELDEYKKTAAQAPPVVTEKPAYIDQLRMAQSGLMEHNEKINRLLEQIDVIKEKEEQQKQILEEKEELNNQISKLRTVLSDKEKEINNIRQKEQLTKEMNSILDSAYSEFNVLQGKIQKLESQLNQSKMLNVEYEDLKETHYKLIRDFEDQKAKLQSISAEHQLLSLQADEINDKLREANFQRQQLQKRVSYLEELNNDLHVVADANKKLESQLRKIGELESMLNVVSEERDTLLRRQPDIK